ncbi:E3 ubiquitin-protein ligase TRIM56-like [Babylonia areolata]|uniref:E3 ubiquitin-protein ligase TRIM56-like n=1 Tax=Babylonia areolata TaxID=304850 RepID=UPI003FD42E25
MMGDGDNPPQPPPPPLPPEEEGGNHPALLQMLEALCRCGACGQRCRSPRALPCLHVLCEACVTQLVMSQVEESPNKTYFPCPTCRQPTDLPKNMDLIGAALADIFPRDSFVTTLINVIDAYGPHTSCDQCFRCDVTTPALNWCTDCHEAACEACTTVHTDPPPVTPSTPTSPRSFPTTPTTPTSPRSFPGSPTTTSPTTINSPTSLSSFQQDLQQQQQQQPHVVIPLEEMRALPLESVMGRSRRVPCSRHPNQTLALFCLECREPCCQRCLATQHRRCERCVRAGDALTSQEADMAEMVLRLQALPAPSGGGGGGGGGSSSALTTLQDVRSGFGDAVEVLDETLRSSRERIRSIAETLRKKIDESEKALLQELEETYQMLKEKVEGTKGPAKDHSKTLRTANDRMQFLLKYGSDVEILQTYETIQGAMKKMDRVGGQNGTVEGGGGEGEEEEEEDSMFRVNFMPDEPVKVFQRDFQTLGHIQIEDCNSDDGLSSWGVTCTSRDEIIVVDCRSKKMQKFTSNGDLIDHIQISEEPRDVTSCGEDDVAITIMKKQIFVVTVTGTMSLKGRIKTEKQYDAISFSPPTDLFLVSCLADTSLDVINRQGDVIRGFNADASGSAIFSVPRYVTFSREGNYVISDVATNTVKCISPEGSLVYSYQPGGAHVLKSPQGLCVDNIGNVFIADYGNSRVQLVTGEGAFQRFVLARESGIKRPVAIHMTTSSKLIVVQSDGMVKVFSYE